MHLSRILDQIKRHPSPSDFARLAAMGNQNNNTDLLMQAINGNKDAINILSTNLNCDVKSIDTALCSIQNAKGKRIKIR